MIYYINNVFLYWATLLLIGYASGAVQWAYFISRYFAKIDIREHGTGNAGATNVSRVVGMRIAIIVLVMDVLKTILPMMLVAHIFYGQIWGLQGYQLLTLLITGFGVILGHCFPFYLKFRGGKGMASTAGMLLIFDWRILIICLTVAVFSVILFKYVSFAAILGVIALAISTTIFYFEYTQIVVLSWIICVVCLMRHRDNMRKILLKEETRWEDRKRA